jgi:hypothetical protein
VLESLGSAVITAPMPAERWPEVIGTANDPAYRSQAGRLLMQVGDASECRGVARRQWQPSGGVHGILRIDIH